MGQDQHGLSEDDLENLLPEVKAAALNWLSHLKKTRSTSYETMKKFIVALNKAKKIPISHKGKELTDSFEITLVRLDPGANLITRTAQYLIDNEAVRMPSV